MQVVNAQEVEALGNVGVPFFGINIGVGLAIPGINAAVSKGLLSHLPAGTSSLVGCRSLEEVVQASNAGADALLLKVEMIEGYAEQGKGVAAMLSDALYACSGDD